MVQIPRIVELWREAKELEDRRLLCGLDGNVNEMTMLANLRTTSSASSRPENSGSNATESVPCVLQVRGCCALMMYCSCQQQQIHCLESCLGNLIVKLSLHPLFLCAGATRRRNCRCSGQLGRCGHGNQDSSYETLESILTDWEHP